MHNTLFSATREYSSNLSSNFYLMILSYIYCFLSYVSLSRNYSTDDTSVITYTLDIFNHLLDLIIPLLVNVSYILVTFSSWERLSILLLFSQLAKYVIKSSTNHLNFEHLVHKFSCSRNMSSFFERINTYIRVRALWDVKLFSRTGYSLNNLILMPSRSSFDLELSQSYISLICVSMSILSFSGIPLYSIFLLNRRLILYSTHSKIL